MLSFICVFVLSDQTLNENEMILCNIAQCDNKVVRVFFIAVTPYISSYHLIVSNSLNDLESNLPAFSPRISSSMVASEFGNTVGQISNRTPTDSVNCHT